MTMTDPTPAPGGRAALRPIDALLAPAFEVTGCTAERDHTALRLRAGEREHTFGLVRADAPSERVAFRVSNLGIIVQTPNPCPEDIAAARRVAELLAPVAERVLRLVDAHAWLIAVRERGDGPIPEATAPSLRAWRRAQLLAVVEAIRVAMPDAERDALRAALSAVGPALDVPADRAIAAVAGLALGDVEAALAAEGKVGDAGLSAVDPERSLLCLLRAAILGRRDVALACADVLAGDVDDFDRTSRLVAHAFTALQRPDRARPWLERALQTAEGTLADELRLALADAAVALDDPAGIEALVAAQPPGSAPDLVLRTAHAAIDAGAFDAAERLLQTVATQHDASALALAELQLWRAEWTAAEATLAPVLGRAPRADRLQAAALVGRGEAERALPFAERAVRSGHEKAQALLVRAEIRLLRSDRGGAVADAVASMELLASTVARLLIAVARSEPGLRLRHKRVKLRSATFLDGFYVDQLPGLCAAAGLSWSGRRAPGHAMMLQLWRRIGGNRSQRLTLIGEGGRSLRYVEAPNGRAVATANLLRLPTTAPEEVLRGFDDVIARYPRSPHPFAYRGELRLWLGDIEGALDDFRRARATGHCRWAYVGSAAAHLLRGELARASYYQRVGKFRYGELRTATTHVYRGEVLRRRGDLAAARRDLEIAVENKPGRVAAAMNLALVYDGLGMHAERDALLARLQRRAPAIIWEASRAAGLPASTAIAPQQLQPIVDAALRLMRGNRSSIVHTLVVEGEVRVVPDPAAWITHARAAMPMLADLLRARMIDDVTADALGET